MFSFQTFIGSGSQSGGDTKPLLKNASSGARIEAGGSQTFYVSWFTDDNTAKIVEVVKNPNYGYLRISSDKKSITYKQYSKQPNVFDSFKIKISNDENKEGIVRCYIDLYGYPIAPKGDMVVTPINTPVDIKPMNNDSGAYLALDSVQQPKNGSITRNGNTITYTPNQDYTGVDVISYTVEAGGVNKESEFIYIYVEAEEAINSYAKADFALTDVNVATTINVLDNDADGVVLNRIDVQPQNGTATINDNTIIYTPNEDYIGEDSFTYIVTDEKNNELSAKVYIYVKEATTKTSCSIGKCKIIANNTNQGVAIQTNPNIELTLKNNTQNVLSYMDGADTKELQPNAESDIQCGNIYIELYKYAPLSFNVETMGQYGIISNSSIGVSAKNETGSNIFAGDTKDNLLELSNDTDTGYKNSIYLSKSDTFQEYKEPTKPAEPTPAHYSDIKIKTFNYSMSISNGSSSEDVLIHNENSNILWYVAPKGSGATNIDPNDEQVISSYKEFSYDENFSHYYGEPTKPAEPTPAHYSNFTVKSLSGNIEVTATSSEDCDIINETGADIKVGDTTVSNNSDLVITENKTITL